MQSDGAGLASRNNIALDVDGIAVATPEQIPRKACSSLRRVTLKVHSAASCLVTLTYSVTGTQALPQQPSTGRSLGSRCSLSKPCLDTIWAWKWANPTFRAALREPKMPYGVSVGGYFVHALQENLFLDGFASLGAGRNDLEMADDTLALTSDYTTQTVALGAAVSGIIEQAGYDILPELSVTYGRTSIGNVGFTGVAYGLTDDTLSLDAGNVSTATILFRPEVRVPMNGLAASDRSSVFSFAPRVMCERVKVASTTNNCGSGAELGISSSSSDGLTSLNTTIIADRVGNSTRSSLQFNLQHKF